jgi:hypothetical protein
VTHISNNVFLGTTSTRSAHLSKKQVSLKLEGGERPNDLPEEGVSRCLLKNDQSENNKQAMHNTITMKVTSIPSSDTS